MCSFNRWSTLEELRLVANTIKHGDGGSADQLKKQHPALFTDPQDPTGVLHGLPMRPLVGQGLPLTEDHFTTYKNCLDQFGTNSRQRCSQSSIGSLPPLTARSGKDPETSTSVSKSRLRHFPKTRCLFPSELAFRQIRLLPSPILEYTAGTFPSTRGIPWPSALQSESCAASRHSPATAAPAMAPLPACLSSTPPTAVRRTPPTR